MMTSDPPVVRRFLKLALHTKFALAVVFLIFGGLNNSASVLPVELQDPYNPWPPYLSREYPDIEDGDKVIKAIQPQVMRQVVEAVLKLAEGALTHVDELIIESKQVQSTYMIEEHVPFPPLQPDRISGRGLVLDLLDAAGDAGKGINSISLVHIEMQKFSDKVKAIAKRYENPIEIPQDPDVLEAFLTQQTEDAKAIHSAVNWSMRGREYVVMWVLSSLAYPDEKLEEYQTRINEILQPMFLDKLETDPIYKKLEFQLEERVAREWAVFMELAEPYAEEEKRLVNLHVARYIKLAEYTKTMQDRLANQVVHFVNETPPEWGEIPFSFNLFNPIRWQSDVFYPPDQLDGYEGRGLVMLKVFFYVQGDDETPYGKVNLSFNNDLFLHWKVLFKAYNAPTIRFVRWTDDGYESLDVLPYHIPIYVIMEFGVEPQEDLRLIDVAAEGVTGITLELMKVEPLLFRSETPFFLEPDVTDQISIDS